MLLELCLVQGGQLRLQRYVRTMFTRLRPQRWPQRLHQNSSRTLDLGQPLGHCSARLFRPGSDGHYIRIQRISALQ